MQNTPNTDTKKPIILKEHQIYSGEDREELLNDILQSDIKLVGMPDEFMDAPTNLGISDKLKANYYIGATWIIENKWPAIVLPKIENLDFIGMLIQALSIDTAAEVTYFSKCYGIEFDKPTITTNMAQDLLTPILLLHYITLLEKVVKNGLKKDYITISENLKCKVKGHIVISQQIKKNIITSRKERNYCNYMIYTEDIPVNRLLKRALYFANAMLRNLNYACAANIQYRINKLMRAFEIVSDDLNVSQVKNFSHNKLFKQYYEAVRVAKDILKRYEYSINAVTENQQRTPPFWIDMPRLFELFVYSTLNKWYPNQIDFQVEGSCGSKVDYIHRGEKIIIDAKYKPKYDYSNSGILPDIREISGYARDISILGHFGKDYVNSNKEIKCLIIYPKGVFDDIEKANISSGLKEEYEELKAEESTPFKNQSSLWNQGHDISRFRNFRKLSIAIPTKTNG